MKNLMKKIISLVLAVCLLVTACPLKANAFETTRIPTDGSWEHPYLPKTSDNDVYIVAKDNAIVRSKPSEKGTVDRRLEKDTYIVGKEITNFIGNKWVEFSDENGEKLYIYEDWVTKEKDHCWKDSVESPSGRVLICDCGFTKIEFYDNSAANLTFDGVQFLKEIALGDYSETHSATGAIASLLLGLTPVGTLMDIRDLSKSVYDCTLGDYCDEAVLVLNMVGFVPIIGDIVGKSFKRAVKVLDAGDLAAKSFNKLEKITYNKVILDTYDGLREIYNGKSRNLRIEIHHLIEKRFAQLFDIKTGEYLSTPLWVVAHDDISKRWIDAIPKTGGDYSHVTLEKMLAAVDEVYHDNDLFRNEARNWVIAHWAG